MYVCCAGAKSVFYPGFGDRKSLYVDLDAHFGTRNEQDTAADHGSGGQRVSLRDFTHTCLVEFAS